MNRSKLTTPAVLYDATLSQLEQIMHQWKQPAFRARQIYRHLYVNHTGNIADMTDLSKNLRQQLTNTMPIGNLQLHDLQTADRGKTRKALFTTQDGHPIETVLIGYRDRVTVCVSTQIGCSMGCTFCATGKLGLQRNLTTGEIVEQVLWAARESRTMPADVGTTFNVVFMGMGEPFANYDNWWAAVERLHDPDGFNLGARRMTVSTVGIVPGIKRLAAESLSINLAISLHAPDDTLRNELVPVNRRYPIDTILQAAYEYTVQTHRRVSFEYVLMQDYNDHPSYAHILVQRLQAFSKPKQALLFHINLIPWNPIPGMPLSSSSFKQVEAFQCIIQDAQIPCTVRVERGTGIAAACGQLAGKAGQERTRTCIEEPHPLPITIA
jgi:23S rRNA (adenine2503-C2)-methyltransferase